MTWFRDPEVFLRCQGGGVVQLWKCKNMSSVQPMKHTDFDYQGDVQDPDDLLEYILDWKQPNGYQSLIDYISQRHLLVNSRGLVISEVDEFGKDGKKADHPIYIRSLDVILLNTYIEKIRQRIPFRTVQYLEAATKTDVPLVEPSPKELKLEVDLKQANNEKQGLEKRLTDSEAKNKNLEGDIKRLMTDLATTKNEKNVLENKINNLEEAIKKMTTPPIFRIFPKADSGYSLTIRGGQVVLAQYNRADICHYWMKYPAHGMYLSDINGRPSFALVNCFTGQALKHPNQSNRVVELTTYQPSVVDESILWTQRELDDGYSFIRTVQNVGLVLDAEHGDSSFGQGQGGIHDGTRVILFEWLAGNNQKWKIDLSYSPILNI